MIDAIVQDHAGYTWLGTGGDGLYVLERGGSVEIRPIMKM